MVPPRPRARPVVIASRIFVPEVAAASARLDWLARSFASLGHPVRVLTTRPPRGTEPVPPRSGVTVRRWPVLRDKAGVVRGYVQYLSFEVPLLVRLLLSPRPLLVVAEPPPTTGLVVALACGLRRVPYAYYAADIWSDAAAATGAPQVVIGLLRRIESAVLRRAVRVLAVSDGVAERLEVLGVDPGRVVIVGNGVDPDVYTPQPEPREAAPPPDAPELYAVYTGTMSEWQGADIFLRALAQAGNALAHAHVVFLGQGSQEPELRALADELLPGRVHFRGLVPPREAARWLRSARLALVSIKPGHGYDFAKPTKVYAAAACGTPVLFAGRGATTELVRSAGLGEAADYDVASVAAALLRCLTAAEEPEAAQRRAGWALEHASLAAVAGAAAAAVLDSVPVGALTPAARPAGR
jgi:glycosyltransferase involved in cell wall biosynthesis